MSRNPRVIAADWDHPVELPDAFCQASSQQGSPEPAENRLPTNEEAVVYTADKSCAGHEVPADTSLTCNRQHFIKDPANGRRQARRNDRSQWMTAEIPELAIIDTKTWEPAQARRRTINAAPLMQRRGPKRLLSGLLTCGVCGASFIIVTKDHVACSAYRNKWTCDNNRTMRMGEIEQRSISWRPMLSPLRWKHIVSSANASAESIAATGAPWSEK